MKPKTTRNSIPEQTSIRPQNIRYTGHIEVLARTYTAIL